MISVMDYVFTRQPEVIAVLSQTGWKPELIPPGEFRPEKERKGFKWWDRLMREVPKGR